METTVKQRLVEYLKHKKLGQNKFEKIAGLSNGYISNLKSAPGSVILTKILTASPDLNRVWLLTGEGEMLKTAEPVLPTVYHAPLISKYAYAGYASGFGDEEYLSQLPKYPFMVDHDPHGIYYAIEVKGDSMDDGTAYSIMDGDICLCRLVPMELYKDSQLHIDKWNYVIVTTDGILIKRVTRHNPQEGTITLHPLNPMYSDINLSMTEVKAVLNVVKIERKPLI